MNARQRAGAAISAWQSGIGVVTERSMSKAPFRRHHPTSRGRLQDVTTNARFSEVSDEKPSNSSQMTLTRVSNALKGLHVGSLIIGWLCDPVYPGPPSL
jgi:hypothetical protein